MKSFKSFLEEAKATPCGRCGTTHVPPSEGGTCPALNKEAYKDMSQDERDKFAQSVGDRYRAKQRSYKVSSMSRKRATRVQEDNYRVHATTHSGEKMTSGKMSKKDADSKHYNMTKATDKRGKKIYKSIEVRKEEVDEQDKTSHPQGSAKFYRGAMDKYKAKTPKKSHWDMYMDKRKKK